MDFNWPVLHDPVSEHELQTFASTRDHTAFEASLDMWHTCLSLVR